MPLHRRRSSVNAVIQISAPFPPRGEACRHPRLNAGVKTRVTSLRSYGRNFFLRCFRNKVYHPAEKTLKRRGAPSGRVSASRFARKTSLPLLIQISTTNFGHFRPTSRSRLYMIRKWRLWEEYLSLAPSGKRNINDIREFSQRRVVIRSWVRFCTVLTRNGFNVVKLFRSMLLPLLTLAS